MGTPERPKPSRGEKTPPPLGPPPFADTPPLTLLEDPHSPAAAAGLPAGETQPITGSYGKAWLPKQR